MDFEKLIMYRNQKNSFANLLGIRITKISEGYAQAEMSTSPKLLNPIGSLHGGCLFTIADIAGGSAACSHGEYVTTVDGSIHYLRAGINTKKLYATATELKRGKKILVYNLSIKDQDGVELAVGIFSFMSLGKPIEL